MDNLLEPPQFPNDEQAAPEAAEEPTLLDLNTADREALISLPGIGPALADGILAARPFHRLDDLQRVDGIGPALVARLRDLVTVVPPEDAAEAEGEAEPSEQPAAPTTPAEPEVEAAAEEEETGGEIEAEVEVEAQAEPEAAPAETAPAGREEEPSVVTRTEALWMALGSGVLAFLLSLLVILGLLTGLNGGLRFVRPAEVQALQQQVAGVQGQVAALAGELNALRDQVNSLQNLTPRVERLETSLQATEDAITDLSARTDALQQQADELSAQVDQIQQQTTRFGDFLNGLYDLLNRMFTSGGGAQ